MKMLKRIILFFSIAVLALCIFNKLYPITNESVTSKSKLLSRTKASNESYKAVTISFAPVYSPTPELTPTLTPRPTLTPSPSPTPTPSPTSPPMAKKGDCGDTVTQIQKRLADLGYLKGAIDGIYGNQTSGAVMAFQKSIGSKATGDVDEDTSRSLFFQFTKPLVSPTITNTPKPTQKTKQAPSFPEYRDKASKGTKYVLNKNSKKFHKPSCSYVKKIKPKNYKEYTGTRDDVIKMGYVPCKVCYP